MNPIVYAALGFVGGMFFEQGRSKEKSTADALKALPASERPLAVGPQCSSWSVIDQERLDLVFRYAYADMRLRGVNDAFQIANGVMDMLAPECRSWGMRPRNMAELDLYAEVFRDVLQDLINDGALPQAGAEHQEAVMTAWYETERRRITGEGVP